MLDEVKENNIKINPKCDKIVDGVVYRKCSGECELEKLLNDDTFYFRHSNNSWRRQCKLCYDELRKKYTLDNHDDILLYQKEYHIKNNDKVKNRVTNYRNENRELVREQNRNSAKRNPESSRRGVKRWRNKVKNDPWYKLRWAISKAVGSALKKQNASKRESILNKLSYNIEQLRQHIEYQFESWMTWDNWKKYDPSTWDDNDSSTWTWELDHIIPVSDLPYDSMNHVNFQKCWSLDNLRPYSAKQNVLDGVRRTRHKIKKVA